MLKKNIFVILSLFLVLGITCCGIKGKIETYDEIEDNTYNK